MNNMVLLENKYELIKNEKDAFVLSEVENLITDYFIVYDYILGDYSYGKLRLKGFNDKDNKYRNKFNDFSMIDNYIEQYCSYQCRYFILKKYNN